MKQQGKTWYTPEGKETLAKYLPKHEVLFEKLGQKIAGVAIDIEHQLRDAKAQFIDLCKEALRNNPDQNVKRRFTFHTFDREYRIEFDIQEEYVRVYRATKKNPSSKDYELVNLDFNKAVIGVTTAEMIEKFVSTSGALDEMADAALGEKELVYRDPVSYDGSSIPPLDVEERVEISRETVIQTAVSSGQMTPEKGIQLSLNDEPLKARDMFDIAAEEESAKAAEAAVSVKPSIMSEEDYYRQHGPRIE
ncbi:MAG TPA: hypothetical protein VGD31_03200 [Sphingobacteriaceae bacterium]